MCASVRFFIGTLPATITRLDWAVLNKAKLQPRGVIHRATSLGVCAGPLTATDIAWKAFEAADIKAADKTAAATLAQAVLSGLAKHEGKEVQRKNEGKSVKWRLVAT
jgi:hypothetical protein